MQKCAIRSGASAIRSGAIAIFQFGAVIFAIFQFWIGNFALFQFGAIPIVNPEIRFLILNSQEKSLVIVFWRSCRQAFCPPPTPPPPRPEFTGTSGSRSEKLRVVVFRLRVNIFTRKSL